MSSSGRAPLNGSLGFLGRVDRSTRPSQEAATVYTRNWTAGVASSMFPFAMKRFAHVGARSSLGGAGLGPSQIGEAGFPAPHSRRFEVAGLAGTVVLGPRKGRFVNPEAEMRRGNRRWGWFPKSLKPKGRWGRFTIAPLTMLPPNHPLQTPGPSNGEPRPMSKALSKTTMLHGQSCFWCCIRLRCGWNSFCAAGPPHKQS